MQTVQPNLFTRPDTFFGVCEGLGQDLGIHPNLLRVVLAGLLFWNPPAAIGAYATAGAVVLLSRLLAPNPRPVAKPAAAAAEPQPIAQDEPQQGDEQADPHLMPLAA